MTPARWARIQELFDAALAQPQGARAAFLAASCGADEPLRTEVESLLAADTGPTPPILVASATTIAGALRASGEHPAAVPAGAGRVLGPYQIVREIGRGGMGTVYLARREDLGIQVALKLLQDGRTTPTAVRRLLAERRVLARLDHPNIARLLDAGVTETGAPYFAMEYVDGAPIVEACDAQRLGVRERLALFAQVCDAVAYAHRNLVVHRDLKPSNVLVRSDGTVKLLDFGIAKLLSPQLDAESAPDASRRAFRPDGPTSGTWLMTPRYAAPEQRRGEAVTTATDVYALGLLLNELVAGQRPPRNSPAVERIAHQIGIARDDPATPIEEVAHARSTTPVRLRRELAGDVAAITARATADDPAARYASADQLASDLNRHARHLPVRARPQTLGYRAATLLRRRRAAALLFASAAIVFALFTVGLARQYRAARRERDRARLEAATSARVTEFTTGLFLGADPWRGGAAVTTARDLVDRAGRRVDSLGGDPVLQARMLGVLGRVNRTLGVMDVARAQLLRALRLQQASRATDPLDLAKTLADIGALAGQTGDYVGADSALRASLVITRAQLGDTARVVGVTRSELANVAWLRGDELEAEQLYRAALVTERGPGRVSIANVPTLVNLGRLLVTQGRYAEAEPTLQEALAIAQAAYGAYHPTVIEVLGQLAAARDGRGDRIAADTLAALAMRLSGVVREARDPAHAATIALAARMRLARGDVAAADSLARSALVLVEAPRRAREESAVVPLGTYSEVRAAAGDTQTALALARETASIAQSSSDAPGSRAALAYAVQLGAMLTRAGEPTAAERVFAGAAPAIATLPATHPVRTAFQLWRGAAYDAAGRSAEAEPLLRDGLARRRTTLPATDQLVAEAERRLGECLAHLGRREEAASLLQHGLVTLRSTRHGNDAYLLPAARRAARASGIGSPPS